MRVIAGTYRGKNLIAPTGLTTRPTSDRARESLFNILNSMLLKSGKNWAEITFADIFAGTGAIGIEALSRGAASTTFIENDSAALKCLRQNTQNMPAATLISCDALTPPPHTPVSVLFMDAPYGKGLWQQSLISFAHQGWIDKNTLIIIETDSQKPETAPGDYTLLQTRSAGRNVFLFLKQEG